MTERPICEAFDLIRQYAEQQGWIPIGFRSFRVGDWGVTVNGTGERRDDVPPFHARVENARYVGLMLFSPFGGGAMGFADTEAEFCAAMRRETDKT